MGMGNINKARINTHLSLLVKKNILLREKRNKNITKMKLLAILFIAEVILIASCETSKKVTEEVKPGAKKAVKTEETSKEVKEVKSEAEKMAKKSSLKERLQDIAKKAKRAKSYYSTSWMATTLPPGWWNHRTTSYPYYACTYDFGTKGTYNWRHHTGSTTTDYPNYDNTGSTLPSTTSDDGGLTTRCRWSGCYCNWDGDCSGSLMCDSNRCSHRSTPDENTTNGYSNGPTAFSRPTTRYVGSEEYRDEEEENERDEERINPRGKDTPNQPTSK